MTCPFHHCEMTAEQRFVLESTDGPVECAKVRCPEGCWWEATITDLEAMT